MGWVNTLSKAASIIGHIGFFSLWKATRQGEWKLWIQINCTPFKNWPFWHILFVVEELIFVRTSHQVEFDTTCFFKERIRDSYIAGYRFTRPSVLVQVGHCWSLIDSLSESGIICFSILVINSPSQKAKYNESLLVIDSTHSTRMPGAPSTPVWY